MTRRLVENFLYYLTGFFIVSLFLVIAFILAFHNTGESVRNDYSEKRDNVVTRSTEAYHSKKHEIAIIYADYYYLEALLKLTGKELFIW